MVTAEWGFVFPPVLCSQCQGCRTLMVQDSDKKKMTYKVRGFSHTPTKMPLDYYKDHSKNKSKALGTFPNDRSEIFINFT